LTLVREKTEKPYREGPLRDAGQVAGLIRSFIGDDPREHFVAVYLDGRHKVVAVHDVSVGTCNGAPVHPREVFLPAVHLGAEALVVAHNHPSGDPTPSIEDRQVTERLKRAGELLGIQVLDHVVLGEARYYSFADESYHGMPESATRSCGQCGKAVPDPMEFCGADCCARHYGFGGQGGA
jgi:DNA repair protein RadC